MELFCVIGNLRDLFSCWPALSFIMWSVAGTRHINFGVTIEDVSMSNFILIQDPQNFLYQTIGTANFENRYLVVDFWFTEISDFVLNILNAM